MQRSWSQQGLVMSRIINQAQVAAFPYARYLLQLLPIAGSPPNVREAFDVG